MDYEKFFDDSFEHIWEIGDEVDFKLGDMLHLYPRFSYSYIPLGEAEYSFNATKREPEHRNCELKDYHKYFEILKNISDFTLGELENQAHKIYHFTTASYAEVGNKRLDKIMETILGDKLPRYENLPDVGHFALYTEEKTDTSKAPRVYFVLGPQAIFYLIALDLEHKIHPTNY